MAQTNKFLDIGDITFKSAESLSSYFGFTDKVNRSYDDRFAKTGAKIGNVTQARLPAQFKFNSDTSSTAIEIQGLNDAAMPVTLNNNYQRSFAVDLVDMSLSVDDFHERYMKPALLSLAAQIDRDGLTTGLQYAQNAVGTPGTAPASLTSLQALFGAAYRKQVENLAPMGDQIFVASQPALNELGYTYMTQLFNPTAVISNLQERGVVAVASNMAFMTSQLTPNYSTGTYAGTPLVNGANQSGSTLNTDGWSAGTTLDVGAAFTIDGVYAINAQTKQSLGYLQQFTVTAKNAAGATQAISVSPSIVGPGDARQNVSALPADNAAITVLGATGVSAPMSLAFNKDAFIFATADITPANSGGGEMSGNGGADFFTASVPDLNISINCSRQFDIRSRQMLVRLDVLGGWAPLYPQLATKIIHG
jgi:hypothetical protein